MTTTIRKFLFAACAVVYLSAPVDAAIMYGDFSDIPPGAVMYLDVTESSSTDPVPPPQYGAPSITGNTLDFDPTAFGAHAENGVPGADLTDGQLNFGFMTVAGAGLKSLTLRESGDFSLVGAGTTITSVAAGIFAEVEISHVNHTALADPITVIASTQFSAALTTSPGLNQPWGNVLFVDFGPALINAGFNPSVDFATKGEVVINDTLAAISEINPNTIAFIAKKDFKVRPGVGIVPEPTTTALCGLALLICGTTSRRR